MDDILGWTQGNWFSLLQSIGIVGGLVFAAFSFREATRARRGTDLLALTKQHQELWSETHRRPELSRITEETLDLVASPISRAEREFLHLIITHTNTAWRLSKEGTAVPLKALSRDVEQFFSLPLPRRVWNEDRKGHDPKFARFVDRCIATGDKKKAASH